MARSIEDMVAEQIARWRAEHGRRLTEKEERRSERPYVVTLSHEEGIAAPQIAHMAGSLLKMPVHDGDVVERIAEAAEVHLETVETLDKHVQSRADEYLTSLFQEKNFDRSDYMRLLTRVVVALWEHGPCVIVGRGCVHIVPRSHALAVRLVAPLEQRAAYVERTTHISAAAARRQVQRADAERRAYHHRFFGADVDDLSNYDLVLDTGAFDVERAAQLITDAFNIKFNAGSLACRERELTLR